MTKRRHPNRAQARATSEQDARAKVNRERAERARFGELYAHLRVHHELDARALAGATTTRDLELLHSAVGAGRCRA